MSSKQRAVAALSVLAAAALAFVLLINTSWQPVQDDIVGNAALGKTSEFDGNVRSPVSEFYAAPDPAEFSRLAAGTVLRSEAIEEAPEGVRAWRIMYVSANNDGEPIPITAYYAEPDRETLTGFPLVGLAHGTTGLVPECGMSQAPFTAGTTGFEYWEFLGRQIVANGWAMVVTDYEGMGAPGNPTYLLRKQGYDVLDSLRAAVRFRPQTVDATKVGIIGHSEGAYAALAAGDMWTAYAPDVMLRGVVSIAPGGVPPLPFAINALSSASGASGAGPRNGYVTYLSTSWAATYPELLSPDAFLTQEGAQIIPEAAKLCQGEVVEELTERFTTYFRADLPKEIVTVAAKNAPITRRSEAPTLLLQGQKDTGIVPQITRGFANLMCFYGSTTEYRQFATDTHRSSVFTSVPAWTDWFTDRFDGLPAGSTCKEL